MTGDYPFEDGRNVRWHLTGFGSDDKLCFEIEVTREEIATLRHLFDRADDEWMAFGEYPVAPELWPALRAALDRTDFSPDIAYFIGATQNLHPAGASRPQGATDTSQTG